MSDNQVKVSCEMIVEKDGKVFMMKRKNVAGDGSWGFCGGHLEHGESTVECVRRELQEELCIIPMNIQLIAVINDIPEFQDNHYLRFVYLIKDWKGEVTNVEPEKCSEIGWFAKDKLPVPLFVGHQRVVDFYIKSNENGYIDNIKVNQG